MNFLHRMQMLNGSFITLRSSDINLHLPLTWDIQWSLTMGHSVVFDQNKRSEFRRTDENSSILITIVSFVTETL